MTEPNLNLNDPALVKSLLGVSVTAVPEHLTDEAVAEGKVSEKLRPAEQLKAKVDKAKQSALFSLKLSSSELARVQRDAYDSGFNEDWQEYLAETIRLKVFNGSVGAAKIHRPSFATKMVTAPTYLK